MTESDRNDGNPLDWIQANRTQVEALAESDRRTADVAQAILEYLDNEKESAGKRV